MFEAEFIQEHDRRKPARDQGTDRPLHCTILNEATSEEDELYVLVERLGENARRGPCKWTPRPGAEPVFPKGGEDAIMIFDTEGVPWILQWWPYD